MKNLEQLGIQEMNAIEIREIEGGGWIAYYAGFLFMEACEAYGEANPVHTCKI